MEKIFDVIETYLINQKSNNALLITGDWGAGKTYFLSNSLGRKIEQLSYRKVYVSLNGLTNSDQIRNLVLSQSIIQGAVTQNKTLAKVTSKLSKNDKGGILSSIASVFDPSDFVIFDKVVICFDDLERISNKFDIEDLLGFINSEYVEHKGHKVILIGNETKNQLASESYRKVKEKLIGWTIEYKPILKDAFISICQIYKDESRFYQYLTDNQAFLIQCIEQLQCNNLRSIVFFLDCFKKVFSIDTKIKDIRIQREIAYFCLVISTEYKKGNLTKDTEFLVKNDRYISMDFFLDNNDSHNTKPQDKLDIYKFEFAKFTQSNFLWVNEISYHYFESIHNFIQNGYLDSEKLISEATLLFEEHEKSKTSEDQTLIENIGGFPHLSNEDFKLNLNVILEKMNSGNFVFGYFLRACEVLYIVQENALIDMSKEELDTFFEKNFSIIEQTTHEFLPNQNYIREHIGRLKKYNPKFYERAWQFFCNIHQICSKKGLFDNFSGFQKSHLKFHLQNVDLQTFTKS